jgi:hypothetical protein
LTASIPFSALAFFFSYAWLAAMISPLAALRCQPELAGLVLADFELSCRHCSSPVFDYSDSGKRYACIAC